MPVLLWFLLGAQEERIDGLIRRLGDDSVEQRESAARELIEIGTPSAPRLRRALRLYPELRPSLLDVLVDVLFSYEASPFVMRHHRESLALLIDGSEEDRIAAIRSMGSALREALPLCRRLLADPSPSIRRECARRLYGRPIPEAAGEFLAEFRENIAEHPRRCDPDLLNLQETVRPLEQQGCHLAREVSELLESKDECARAAAAWLLGRWKWKEAAPSLRRRLADECRLVRVAAGEALLEIGDEASLPEFETISEGEDVLLRLIAARALVRRGKGDPSDWFRDARTVIWTLKRYEMDNPSKLLWNHAKGLLLDHGDARDAALVLLRYPHLYSPHEIQQEALRRHPAAALERAGLDLYCKIADPRSLSILRFPGPESQRLALEILRKKAPTAIERSYVAYILNSTPDHEDPSLKAEFAAEVRRTLQDSDPQFVLGAVRYLYRTEAKEAADDVFSLYLRRPGSALAAAAVHLSSGRHLPRILQDLRAGNLSLDSDGAEALLPFASKEEADTILESLDSDRERASALWNAEGPDFNRRLRQLLAGTTNSDLAEDLIRALGNRGDSEAAGLIRKWTAQHTESVYEALIEIGDRAVADDLVRLALQEDDLGALAIEGLFRLSHPKAIPLGRERLFAQDRRERWRAARLLLEAGDRGAVETMFRMGLAEEEPEAIDLLAPIDRDRARELARRLLVRAPKQVLFLFELLAETSDTALLKPYLDDPYAARALESAFAPPIAGVLEAKEERRPLREWVDLFNRHFRIRIVCSVEANEPVWVYGRCTFLEAMARLPEHLAWIHDGDCVRIVKSEECVARWKKRLGN